MNVQSKGWVDKRIFLDWIARVWVPAIQEKAGLSFLLLDEFSVHLHSEVNKAFSLVETETEFIPPSYTNVLQVMDVGLNKPFKEKVREGYNAFMIRNPHGTKVRRWDVSHWVKNSWDLLPHSAAINTWNSIGFTNENSI